MSAKSSWINLSQRLRIPASEWDSQSWQLLCHLRVALPGIVQSFDPSRLTVTVQPSIRENINVPTADGLGSAAPVPTPVILPVLQDVPLFLFGGGGFSVCPPVSPGDECLLVFADMCFDAWWQSGGVQNQVDRRRHDLSDAFALVGFRSQPRVLSGYSTSALQIRSDDGNTVIEVGPAGITMTPDGGTTQIKITAGEIDLTATTVKINGASYALHKHTGVAAGASNTGPVL